MNASHRVRKFWLRGLTALAWPLAVAMLLTAVNPGSAEARHRGRSSKYAKTPSGKVMKYRPSLQVTRQG